MCWPVSRRIFVSEIVSSRWPAETAGAAAGAARAGAGAGAAGGAVAQELLGSRRAIHFADVHIAVGVGRDYVRPMELAGLAAAAADASQLG